MRSLQPTLPDMFGSELPTDPKAALFDDDEVTVVKDHEPETGRRQLKAGGPAGEEEITAVTDLSSLAASIKNPRSAPQPTSLGAPDADDETEEAVPTAPRPAAPPPPPTPMTSRLPLTLRAPVPPPPTRPPARKSAVPPTIRSAARDSGRPPPPPEPSSATPGPARALLLKAPAADDVLSPPPRPSIPPPPPSSRTTYVPPSLPPRGRIKLDSIDQLPSIGLPPPQFTKAPAFNAGATVPAIPPPPPLPHSLAPTSLSNPPPPPVRSILSRPLRASAVAVAAGVVLGSCLTLVVVALSKRGAAAGSDAELMMSAAAANGAALRGVELFVNGERRCSQMPCRVEGVGSGAHLVRLTVRETPKVTPHLSLDELPPSEDKPEVNVEDRSSRSHVKPREPAPPPEPAKAALPSAPAETTPATTGAAAESAPARSSASTVSHAAAASPAPASAAAVSNAAAAPLGTINVTSNTPANVAVDGKVLGRAPRSIRVSSGVHTVVIAGAKGRRVQTVRVESGRPRRVAARF